MLFRSSTRASAIAAALHGGRGATQAHARSVTLLSAPPPAFTVGVLTAADAAANTLTLAVAAGTLTATDASGRLTATDQATGTLTASEQAGGPS